MSAAGGGDSDAAQKARQHQYNLIVTSLDGNIKIPTWSLDAFTMKQGSGNKVVSSSNNDIIQMLHGDPSCAITAIQLSADRNKLYVGTSIGTLRVYPWPPEFLPTSSTTAVTATTSHTHTTSNNSTTTPQKVCYYEIYTHAGPVVAIKLSPVDHTIISAAADGSIFIHNEIITNTTTTNNTANTDLYDNLSDVIILNDDVVLMSSEDIEEHINDIINLQKELLETTNKNDFLNRKLISDHNESIKLIIEQNEILLNKEREANEIYKIAAEKRITEFANNIELKDSDNQRIRTELENKYEHKLAESLERYDNLSEKMQLLKLKCEGLLESEKNSFNKQLNDLKMDNHNKEKKLKTDHRRAVDDKNANESAFMEILKQQENEYEDELKQMIDAVS